ncbi:MAG: PspC domain-containing protein [Micromonosporaceae bacterium]|nr:PspC domain-containing protein [Micromonosporaceae bacterium]
MAGGAFPAAGGAVPPPGGYQPPGNPPPGYQPPGNPPPGYQPPGYPPPAAAGWASRRYGLVRPTSGRVFAGVCGALGRATNTDPVLWRVLLAVFTLVGGIGLLVYVIGWLFIPAEGDTASPIEALLGRGRSSTSPVLVIVITAIVVIAMGSVISRGVRSSFFPVGIVIVAIILIARRTRHAAPGSTPVPPGQAPPEAMPGGAMPGAPVPGPAGQVPVTATTGPAGATAPGGPAGATGPAQPQPAGYRPPFAPHGPYAMGSRYPYPGLTFTPTMEPASASAPPARQRSRLGWVFFALALVTAGIMGVVGGHRISVGAYIAVPLAVIGIGLVVGAWAGRARGLIFPGLLLTLALAATPVHLNLQPGSGDVTWAPISYSDLAHEYRHGLGDVRLDLSRIDFTGHPDTNVVLRTNAGDVRVTLPSKVDATVDVTIRAGDAQVLGTNWSSPQSGRHTVSDDGSDGPGGGALHLTIQMDLGSLRVER